MRRFIEFALLAFPLALFATDSRQVTKGNCSPAVADIKGNVIINCPGITPEAKKVLNALLRKIKGLERKIDAANDWAEQYHELETRLAAEGENKVLAQQARKLLGKGDLDSAARLFDRVIQQQNEELGDLAENLFNRAQIASLQFRPSEALGFLDQAYRLKPENPQYAHEYALVLYHEGRWDNAEHVLVAEIEILQRQEPTENKSEFLAKALNNLGGLQAETLRFGDAERNIKEAQKIYRQLVQLDRLKFLPYLASTLGNSAGTEAKTFRFNEAENDFAESIQLLESIVGDLDPKALRDSQEKQKASTHLISALNNLTFLWVQEKNVPKAEECVTRALNLARQLVLIDPRRYEEVLVQTLQNAVGVQLATGKLDAAERTSSEGLEHARQMAADDPDAYNVLLARSMTNECGLMRTRGRFLDAATACKEALDLYVKLRERDSRGYGAEQSITLLSLAEIHLGLAKPGEAKAYYEQALSLEREVAAKAPAAEQLQFAKVLHDSALYGLASGQFESARVGLKEAVPLLRDLSEKYPDLMPLLGESLNTLGGIEGTAGMWDDAGRDLMEAEKIEKPLAEKDVMQFGAMLGMIYNNLAAYYRINAKGTEAETCLRNAVSIRKKIASANPDFQPLVLNSLFTLSALYRDEQKWLEATETSQEAVAISRTLPSTPLNNILLTEQLENLAAAEIGAGNLGEAAHPLNEGLRAYREAAKDESYKDPVVRSVFVMSTAMSDKTLKCEFLQKAEAMLAEPALINYIRQSLQECK